MICETRRNNNDEEKSSVQKKKKENKSLQLKILYRLSLIKVNIFKKY